MSDFVVTTSEWHRLVTVPADVTFWLRASRWRGRLVGTAPRALTAADLNGDGRTDLAVANSTDNTVTVLSADAAGAMVYSATLVTGTTPLAIVAANLNGDAAPDLLIANNADYTDTLYLNRGGGVFGTITAAVTTVGVAPAAGTAADFNADGKLDLAVVNSGSANVTVLSGQGDGTFSPTNYFASVGSTPYSIVSADFNADGKTDLAVANSGSNSVSILINSGNGMFASPTSVTVGTTPFVTADFNGDGRPDLATANNGATTISVLLRTAAGGFTRTDVATGSTSLHPYSLVAADFNNDGKADLASALGASSAPSLTTLLGTGTGGFQQPKMSSFSGAVAPIVAQPYYQLTAGDFNGDGFLDLTVDQPIDSFLTTVVGHGDGTFAFEFLSTTPAGGVAATAATDFDGDGLIDLAAATSQSTTANGTVTILHHTFDYDVDKTGNPLISQFLQSSGLVVPGMPTAVVPGDFNSDGKPDVATIFGGGSVGMLLNRYQPNPTVGLSASTLTVSGPATITVGPDDVAHQNLITINTPAGIERYLGSSVAQVVVSGVGIRVSSDLGNLHGLAGVTVAAGGAVTFATPQTLPDLTVNGDAAVAVGGSNALRLGGLHVAPQGRLDLNDNDLVLAYTGDTPLGTVRAQLAAGRAGGTWTGFGLVSTAALSDGRTTLGYMDAGDYRAIYGADASFDGQPLPAQAVVVKYTFAGDADFNDKVDFNDFLRLQNAFGQNEQTSAGGDFDFSGTVDFNDFLLLQNSFGQSIAAPAVTPEPAAVAATATIAGVLFNDHDRNGKFDKGDGLSRGVSVWLDLDNDRVHDPNEPTAVTDDKGRFGFKNLAAGKYRVRQVLAKGALESTPARYLTLAKGQAVKGVELGSRTK